MMLISLLTLFISYSFCDCNLIRIKDGELLGETLSTISGRKYEVYRKIPFAKPPIGSLRFQPPQPPVPWLGIRNATERSPICIQNTNYVNQLDAIIQGDEDCLYLDVFKPQKISRQLPVMVHIHGGALKLGSGSFCDPVYFMDYEIIMVMIQYRLNAFGFLSTNDEIMPGNIGMKDQVAAMKWVQKNIAAFGGNPNMVTLVGNSAGGISVHFHLFSPLSKGLFHRAIIQSGNAFLPTSFSTAEIVKKKTLFLAENLQCSTKSSQKLMSCLQKVPAELLTIMHERLYLWSLEPTIALSVVNEPSSVGAFITEFPQRIINNVPIIIGINRGDGIFKLAYAYNNPKQFEMLQKDLKRTLPYIFNYRLWIEDEKQLSVIADSLLNHYLHGNNIGMDTLDELIELFTDGYFAVTSVEAAKIQEKPVYLYLYEHRNVHSYRDAIFLFPQNASKKNYNCHADDLISFCYLPQNNFTMLKNGSDDFQVSQRMIKYWVNFAYKGSPNDEHELWKPVKSDQLEYLHITTFEDNMKTGFRNHSYEFWKNLGLISPRFGGRNLNVKDEL